MKSAPRGGRTRGADAVATAALVWAALLVLGLAARPVATDDLWWHLALGEVYADQGLSVPEDPLFHTALMESPGGRKACETTTGRAVEELTPPTS